MIHVEKSQPAPDCLEKEKNKATGDYKCGDVLLRLHADFRNKCYICESKAPSSINVEHFISHRGNKDLKFGWNNLFFACNHCNNTKSIGYDDILNCTSPNDKVDEWIKYEVNPFPKEKVKITILREDAKIHNTAELLEKVYNGHTPLKTLEAANIRQNLINEIRDFQSHLFDYFQEGLNEEYKSEIKRKIELGLSPYSGYTAFKKWIIRNNEVFIEEFGEFL